MLAFVENHYKLQIVGKTEKKESLGKSTRTLRTKLQCNCSNIGMKLDNLLESVFQLSLNALHSLCTAGCSTQALVWWRCISLSSLPEWTLPSKSRTNNELKKEVKTLSQAWIKGSILFPRDFTDLAHQRSHILGNMERVNSSNGDHILTNSFISRRIRTLLNNRNNRASDISRTVTLMWYCKQVQNTRS